MIESSTISALKNYIGGAFQTPRRGEYLESVNPATAEVIYKVPDSDETDIENAYRSASQAFPAWSKTTRVERSQWLHRLADALEAKMMEFAIAESNDQGKTLKQALEMEIPRCVTNLRYFANLVTNLHGVASEFEMVVKARSVTHYEPIGVVGIIVPWNLPLYLLTWKIAPALAMGNCVVAKPSELTSLTAYKFAELAQEVGFPAGVLNIIFGRGATTGRAIVAHPGIPAISFTGGTVTGRTIAELAGSLGKKVSLELGGKNPGIIFADCEGLETVVEACVKSAFTNQGEVCLCTSRLYVERPIYQQFLSMFQKQVGALKVGDPSDKNVDMGALVSGDHLKKVTSYLELAREERAEIFSGTLNGKAGERGFFCAPTIITNVQNHDSRLIQEEIFGPIVVVWPFDSDDEVIALANDVSYGLAASVWTSNGKRAERMARSIKVGQVWINCWMVRDLSMPFGGVKASGHGREGGRDVLAFYSDIKTITTAL